MSETDPQGGAETPAEPAATAAEAPAPADTGAATETEETAEPAKPSRTERRIAALSARLSAGEQREARLAQEVEQYRRQGQPQAAQEQEFTPAQIAAMDKRLADMRAKERFDERGKAFHEAGKAAFKDWGERCSSLMQMGADSQFAEILLEIPNGAKVAGALADDPEALEAITALRSERSRAIALGKYAATLETREPPARKTSPLPAPIKPIAGATARTELNQYAASAQKLVDVYSKELAEKSGRR